LINGCPGFAGAILWIRYRFFRFPVKGASSALLRRVDVGHWYITYLPVMQTLFGTADLDAAAWLRIGVFGLALLLIVEAEKAVMRQMGTGVNRRR
jgi:hypothetical protein